MLLTCKILKNEKMTEKYDIYSMELEAEKIAKIAKPGQIVHVKCDSLTLRRPISITSAKNGVVRLCYDVRGEGTKWMSEQAQGDTIDLLGPVGNGFDVSDTNKKILLVGGGIGVYPLYSVAEKYGANSVCVLGFRNKDIITLKDDFISTGTDLKIATDDGSFGYKGFAIELVRETLDEMRIDMIMTCGPKVMMKGIVGEAVKRNIPVLASMEERMGCGVGACLGCVCRVKSGGSDEFTNKRVCIDGPVFDGAALLFE